MQISKSRRNLVKVKLDKKRLKASQSQAALIPARKGLKSKPKITPVRDKDYSVLKLHKIEGNPKSAKKGKKPIKGVKSPPKVQPKGKSKTKAQKKRDGNIFI